MTRKIESLQGLRAWAILLVVLWHLNSLFPGTLPGIGDRGVEWFLLLSGFLVARKDVPLSGFRASGSYMLRKLKSSYLLYLVPAVPVFLLDVFAGPVRTAAPQWQLISYCTLTQPWIPDPLVYWGVNGAGWYLPVILFCYLMTPVIHRVVRRFGPRPVLLACLVLQFAADFLAQRFLSETVCDWLLYVFPLFRITDYALGFCAWHLFGTRGLMRPSRSRPDSRDASRPAFSASDVLYIVLLLVLAGLTLKRPDFLKYVVHHPFDLALVVTVASEKSVLSNLLNRNRAALYLGNLSRVIFFTHIPVIRLTGIVWRRFFSADLVFPLWLVSLLMILLTAVVIDRLMNRFRKAAKKAP